MVSELLDYDICFEMGHKRRNRLLNAEKLKLGREAKKLRRQLNKENCANGENNGCNLRNSEELATHTGRVDNVEKLATWVTSPVDLLFKNSTHGMATRVTSRINKNHIVAFVRLYILVLAFAARV